MPAYHPPPMRRKDRARDDADIVAFLEFAPFGFLASIDNDQPVLTVNTFVYDKVTHAIYLHTARKSFTKSTIESNERVSFAAARLGRLLPATVAKELSAEFESVIVYGRGKITDDIQLAREKMQLLNDKYFPHLKPGKDYRPMTPGELAEIAVYQILIDSWSGKRKREAKDFPGAFEYGSGRCPF